MRLTIWTTLLFMGVSQVSLEQTNARANPVSGKEAPAAPPANNYAVIGASPIREAYLRGQIEIMQPTVRPLRIVFVPHWKYIDAARTFQLHIPPGYTSAMFTHLASRTTFIDSDRYQGEDWLGYWMAHELGHLATNSTKEGDAERAAREYRNRLKQSLQAKSHSCGRTING
jgi:hypothetical protein